MLAKLRGAPELRVICAYAPQAAASEAAKETFYSKLQALINRRQNSLTIVLGDFNARLQASSNPGKPVGRWVYPHSSASSATSQNREILLRLADSLNLRVMNTFFKIEKGLLAFW